MSKGKSIPSYLHGNYLFRGYSLEDFTAISRIVISATLFCYSRSYRRKIATITSSLLLSSPAWGQITQSLEGKALPLWEAGLAFVSAVVPAYPGSEDSNTFFLPVPTFFYRGRVLRADEEGGMRSRFFRGDTWEINLSIGGSLPASSKDVRAREGMPNLKTMIELGPGLLTTLWKKKGPTYYKLGLNVPIRTAWAVDFFEADQKGFVFNPLLYFVTEGLIGKGTFTFTSLSSIFATTKFHRVFYQVDPQFALSTRPTYEAKGGYLGSTASMGFSRTLFKDLRAFLGFSYTNYQGAANEDSPLLKQNYNFSGAIGFVWWFYESEAPEKL